MIGLSTDISERKRAEEAIRQSRERLAEAQQIAGVGSLHWDTARREVEWSDELRRMLAIPAGSEPLGADALELVHGDDRARRSRRRRATRWRSGGTIELDLRMPAPTARSA